MLARRACEWEQMPAIPGYSQGLLRGQLLKEINGPSWGEFVANQLKEQDIR